MSVWLRPAVSPRAASQPVPGSAPAQALPHGDGILGRVQGQVTGALLRALPVPQPVSSVAPGQPQPLPTVEYKCRGPEEQLQGTDLSSSGVCPQTRPGTQPRPVHTARIQPSSLCSAIFKTPKENSHLCLLETWRVPRSQELCSFSNLPELASDIKPNKQTERGLLCKKVPPN